MSPPAQSTRNTLLIASACLLGLLSTTGASLPYPILAPLFAGDGGNGLTGFLGLPAKLLLGVALMVNPLGLLIGSAVLGAISDRFGRRCMLLATALGSALGHENVKKSPWLRCLVLPYTRTVFDSAPCPDVFFTFSTA